MFWNRKATLGIDIGSYAVKSCLMDASGKEFKLANQVIWPERTAREQGQESELQARLVELITEVVQIVGPGKVRLRISHDEGYRSTGYLELPANLSKSQLQVALPAAIARQVPQGLDGLEVAAQPVPALHDQTASGRFFVAAQKSGLSALLPALTRLGVSHVSMESGLLGLIRGLVHGFKPAPEKVWLAVDVGFRATHVLLMRGPNPYFYRDFRLAGGDFTYAFQMGEQVSWSCAESRKRAYHLEEKDFQVESFIKRWLQELRKSQDYIQRAYPGLRPEQVVLSGGSSLWPGLAQRLEEGLGLPTQALPWGEKQLSPWRPEDPRSMPLYNTALGLVSA